MKKLLLALISVMYFFNTQAQIVTGFNNITDTDGNTHSLSTYLNDGKFVVLNFYLLTCGNCMATAPKIESIYQNYGQNQCNVVVLSFNITNPATNTDCDNFASTYGNPSPPNFNYTQASWFQFYSIHGGSFAQTYVVTPHGDSVIYAHAGGVLNQPILESTLDNAIANSSTNVTACNSYTWPVNGATYTTSGIYTAPSPSGCPPYTETLNLTITTSTSIDTQTACNTYTWIDGITYTSNNNTATYTTINSNGCDSVITLNLTINSPSISTDIQTACNTYTWIDGITYTSNNNTATYTIINSNGCDSVITLNLTVTGNPISIISQNGTDLEVTISDTYIWNTGETTQTITPTANGWYWCIVTDINGCIADTSFYEVINIVSAINEIKNTDKQLLRISNLLGQKTPYKKNQPLFYIYDDGTVEKRMTIE